MNYPDPPRRVPADLRLLGLATLLLLLAAFLPTAWYDGIPRRSDLPPPPFRGVTLLRLMFAIQGGVVLWLATRAKFFRAIAAPNLLPMPPIAEDSGGLSETRARWLVATITVLALFLRIHGAGADLWLDEITPLVDYGPMSVAQVIGSYLRSNNHLLNTLLGKAAIGAFGESEWSVRLPAILFGAATVPLVYLVSRPALPRLVSAAVALLIATSYHHIFFSQNARGYTAYLFFALAASALFVRGVSSDRLSTWCLYVVTLLLGFASLLNTVFVGAGHAIVGAAAAVVIRRRGGAAGPLLRRLTLVFGTAAFLAVQLYAAALPEIYTVITSVYVQPATGFSPWTLEFVREVVRGVSAGFGPGVLVAALPFLGVAMLGYGSLLTRHWSLTLSLTLPGVLTALFLAVRDLTFSPRFFLLWLPLAVMASVQGVWHGARWLSTKWVRERSAAERQRNVGHTISGAALLLLAAVSLSALPRYYATPKQPYRAALRYLETIRRPGDRIAIVYTAEAGFRYYVPRLAGDSEPYSFVRTVAAFDSVRGRVGAGRFLVVTTFPRGLRTDLPDLHAAIEDDWAVDRVFRASVGDGDITIWHPKR